MHFTNGYIEQNSINKKYLLNYFDKTFVKYLEFISSLIKLLWESYIIRILFLESSSRKK